MTRGRVDDPQVAVGSAGDALRVAQDRGHRGRAAGWGSAADYGNLLQAAT